jgi:hypothetical protein
LRGANSADELLLAAAVDNDFSPSGFWPSLLEGPAGIVGHGNLLRRFEQDATRTGEHAMSRFLGLALVLCAGSLAGATELSNFVYRSTLDFHRNNAWPEPFIYPDRAAVCAPFGVMIHNGWRLQNTLAAHHFREGSMELTESGKLKVLWIVTEVPPQNRTIYVERAGLPQITEGRIRNVQIIAAGSSMEGVSPPVFETGVPARGWPADQIDATTRAFHDSAPAPRLPDRISQGRSVCPPRHGHRRRRGDVQDRSANAVYGQASRRSPRTRPQV